MNEICHSALRELIRRRGEIDAAIAHFEQLVDRQGIEADVHAAEHAPAVPLDLLRRSAKVIEIRSAARWTD